MPVRPFWIGSAAGYGLEEGIDNAVLAQDVAPTVASIEDMITVTTLGSTIIAIRPAAGWHAFAGEWDEHHSIKITAKACPRWQILRLASGVLHFRSFAPL
jgi:hypothetical protein